MKRCDKKEDEVRRQFAFLITHTAQSHIPPQVHPWLCLPLTFWTLSLARSLWHKAAVPVLWSITTICRGGQSIICHISTLTSSFPRSHKMYTHALICICVQMNIKLSLKGRAERGDHSCMMNTWKQHFQIWGNFIYLDALHLHTQTRGTVLHTYDTTWITSISLT